MDNYYEEYNQYFSDEIGINIENNKIDGNNEDFYTETIKNVTLARAYVPFQKMDQIYSAREGLQKGTAFPELYQPYF